MADRIFPPQIDEQGRVRAGGMTMFELRRDGRLVLYDRWRERCRERGTQYVSVDLVDLIEEIIRYWQAET